jgi:hypothetical protein
MGDPGASSARPRPSKSADAANRAELERILRMTPLERVALALSLGRRRLEIERRRGESKP